MQALPYQEPVISARRNRAIVHDEGSWTERTQPWLGTLVTIGIAGLSTRRSETLIRRGFATVRRVHGLMSFHQCDSDVSRLNRLAYRRPVAVHPHTLKVLRLAQRVARVSGGVFDVTVAPQLVATHFLPTPALAPALAPAPDPAASWRDIQILRNGSIRFRRPLWIDLGGIAKGYAVDAAIESMRAPRGTSVFVNAGGDLRIAGPQAKRVLLDTGATLRTRLPMLELTNQALASSSGLPTRRRQNNAWVSPHRHGISHRSLPTRTFVSVAAPDCATADALTKIVLACGAHSEGVLRRFGATAFELRPQRAWRQFGRIT